MTTTKSGVTPINPDDWQLNPSDYQIDLTEIESRLLNIESRLTNIEQILKDLAKQNSWPGLLRLLPTPINKKFISYRPSIT